MSQSKNHETALYAFSVEPSHDHETLERYLKQYPQLTDELIDLAFELRFAEAQAPVQSTPTPDMGLEQAWQEFIICSPAKAGGFLSKFRGAAFVELAARLKMPRSILVAFRDKLVEHSSVPERILRSLAEATESSVQTVRDYLSGPPVIIQTAQFKADKKPTQQGRVSFRQLVESTQMTDEERERLLQDCDTDGLDRG